MENNIQTVKHEKLVQLEDALHKARIISWTCGICAIACACITAVSGARTKETYKALENERAVTQEVRDRLALSEEERKRKEAEYDSLREEYAAARTAFTELDTQYREALERTEEAEQKNEDAVKALRGALAILENEDIRITE